MTIVAYKYRLHPTKAQEHLLSHFFGCKRVVYNTILAEAKETFERKAFSFDIFDYKRVTADSEKAFLKEVSQAALQQAVIDLKENWTQFMRGLSGKRKSKLGNLNFKTKDGFQSFRLPNQKVRLKDNMLKLERLPWMKMTIDREIPSEARLLSCTVKRYPSGEYYATLCCEQEATPLEKTGKYVGIDVGLSHFICTSDGEKVLPERHYRLAQAKLAKAQRALARKVKRSNRYTRQKTKVAKLHQKVARKREHLQHVLSWRLVRDYDLICAETLNIAGMMKNSKLSKAIADAGWSLFINKLEYKAVRYQKQFQKIDRYFPSSKTCSSCGRKVEALHLSVRSWTCESCGTEHDRDVNAAKNILKEGYALLTGEPLESTRLNERRGDVKPFTVVSYEAFRNHNVS